jgi:four helix bundle protein
MSLRFKFMEEYPLKKRTLDFGKEVTKLCRSLELGVVNRPLISQLVRSGTSVGANYCEANGASSKKDFKNKIHICKKEAQETMYWLEIIKDGNQPHHEKIKDIMTECEALCRIFGKIISTINQNEKLKN